MRVIQYFVFIGLCFGAGRGLSAGMTSYHAENPGAPVSEAAASTTGSMFSALFQNIKGEGFSRQGLGTDRIVTVPLAQLPTSEAQSQYMANLAKTNGGDWRNLGDDGTNVNFVRPANVAKWDVDFAASRGVPTGRCFPRDRVLRVGAAGLYPVRPPYPAVVPVLGGNVPGETRTYDGNINIDRFLRQLTVMTAGVAVDKPEGLDKRLLTYLKDLKNEINFINFYFGEPGLELVRASHGSPAERAVLDTIRQRSRAGAPELTADKAVVSELEMLVDHPEDFLPCQLGG